MGTAPRFSIIFLKETTFTTSVCFPGGQNPFKMASTQKQKNLLQLEQILSFKS